MRKTFVNILLGVAFLTPFFVPLAEGEEWTPGSPAYAPAAPANNDDWYDSDYDDYDEDYNPPSGNWSSPDFHPEIGDRIVKVNGHNVYNEGQFRRAVRNSSSMIYLSVIDKRSGRTYQLRTRLWSPDNTTRLGMYISTHPQGGVYVTGFVSGSPAMHCQFLEGDVAPVRDGYWW